MNKPLISVIVPVYNVEAYLHQCVDSIINQTYKNLEIILVNDGSTDSSGAICDEYASQDSRVRVIHKPNGGLSSARNAGMDIMTGEYVSFVDSDDWLELDMYASFMEIIQKYGVHCVKSKYTRSDNKRNTSGKISLYEGMKGYMQVAAKATACVWNALYHRDYIKSIHFHEGYLCEDVPYSLEFFSQPSLRFAYYDKAFYHYRINPNSIMTTNKMEHLNHQLYLVMKKSMSRLSNLQHIDIAQSNIFFMYVIQGVERQLIGDIDNGLADKTSIEKRQSIIADMWEEAKHYPADMSITPFWLKVYIKFPLFYWLIKRPRLFFKFKAYIGRI